VESKVSTTTTATPAAAATTTTTKITINHIAKTVTEQQKGINL